MAKNDSVDVANAFWSWSKSLSDLIFWAREPDAKTTSTAEWNDAIRHDLQSKGDRARDAAPDATAKNRVIRARSLTAGLVRILHECDDLNSIPCRNWPTTERSIVEELIKLNSTFAELGDGSQSKQVREAGKKSSPREDNPDEDEIAMARQICKANPNITWESLRKQMEIGGTKTTELFSIMRKEELIKSKPRRKKPI